MLTDTPGVIQPQAQPPRLRFRVLEWLARRLPKREIRSSGDRYLERYYLAGPLDAHTTDLWPAEDRPRARLRWLRRTWYLHRFLAPDPGRELHDHPWDGRGMILAGGYVELRAGVTGRDCRVYGEGSLTHVTPGEYHRIAILCRPIGGDPREVWTLMGVGPRIAPGWGFLVRGEHVPHAEHAKAPPVLY